MPVDFQVSFDADQPRRLGEFWAQALGYVEQPPPEGHDSWDSYADSVGMPADERESVYAVVDPDGARPRLLFQRVPEGKAAKNRVHLDLHVSAGHPPLERAGIVRAEADRLVGLGAHELREATERGEHWVVLQDPEGNEFCVQ